MSQPEHGTWARYNRGCREECCRTAARQYQKHRIHDRNRGKERLVPASGTKRRLQALAAIGWDFYKIGTEMGEHREWVWQIYRRDTVRVDTARKVAEAYERLCMVVPEGWVADRARRNAARKGWVPPLLWDDIDNDDAPKFIADHDEANFIDEVKVQRVLSGRLEDCNPAERLAVIDAWTGSINELERLTGWNIHRMIARGKAA